MPIVHTSVLRNTCAKRVAMRYTTNIIEPKNLLAKMPASYVSRIRSETEHAVHRYDMEGRHIGLPLHLRTEKDADIYKHYAKRMRISVSALCNARGNVSGIPRIPKP